MKRYAMRRDYNEPAIIEALTLVGAAVQQLDPPLPDLLVGWRGRLFLLEVKLPLTARGALPTGRSLKHKGGRDDMTASQARWWDAWKGPPPAIVRTPKDALKAIGASE